MLVHTNRRIWLVRVFAMALAGAALVAPLTVVATESPNDFRTSRNIHKAPAAFIELERQAELDAIAADMNEVNADDTGIANLTDHRTAGQAIIDYAQAYIGYPYYAAGNGPYGFDCSGFTQFVMLNVLGIDIGHAVEGQPGAGAWVDYGAWLPGDLIFFQNTYRAGISHVGIYIGDGLIVHAENESTGVTVDSIWSDYYAARYWGAIRVG